MILGTAAAAIHMYKNTYTKGFIVTLAMLPLVVQVVIMLVNGNLGTGVAVAGAFSLIRFRSVPGTARDICAIFLSMVIGIATGTGYIFIGAALVAVFGVMTLIYVLTGFGGRRKPEKSLKITIPEGLDYTGVFDDLFEKYTTSCELEQVKTTNMGSLYQLKYVIRLKSAEIEKQFIDDLRCRNGNLEISCGKVSTGRDEL